MPLKGKAKTDYQRQYMRRKRAGLPTATLRPPKPKPPDKPIRERHCSFCYGYSTGARCSETSREPFARSVSARPFRPCCRLLSSVACLDRRAALAVAAGAFLAPGRYGRPSDLEDGTGGLPWRAFPLARLSACVPRGAALPQKISLTGHPNGSKSARAVGGSRLLSPCQARAGAAAAQL